MLENPARARSDAPLAVLVNHGSASASEILAGALRDNGRLVALVGETTYGKGKIQSVFELDDGSALFVTVAKCAPRPPGRRSRRVRVWRGSHLAATAARCWQRIGTGRRARAAGCRSQGPSGVRAPAAQLRMQAPGLAHSRLRPDLLRRSPGAAHSCAVGLRTRAGARRCSLVAQQ